MKGALAVLAWLLAVSALALPGGSASAQPPAGSDSTDPGPPPFTPPRSGVTSRVQRTGEEMDRFELGGAIPRGEFDFLGTFGYRRFIREGGPFEQSILVEAGGTGKDHITEGSLSLYYLFRPLASYKPEWRIRPIVEIGPGGHVVVQSADIEGFDDSAFHSQAYLKTHLYAGFEYLVSGKLGFLVRGRVSVPEHKPLDYAQAAIFLR